MLLLCAQRTHRDRVDLDGLGAAIGEGNVDGGGGGDERERGEGERHGRERQKGDGVVTAGGGKSTAVPVAKTDDAPSRPGSGFCCVFVGWVREV